MHKKVKKFLNYTGLVGSGVMIVAALVSAIMYRGSQGEHYSMLNHFISELGQYGVSQYAIVFNVSLVIGGMFLAFFAIRLGLYLRTWLSYIAMVVGVWSGVSCGLVGIFPMNNMDAHTLVAMSFFRSGLIAIAIFTLVVGIDKRHNMTRLMMIPGVIAVLAFSLFLFVPRIDKTIGGTFTLSVLANRPQFWIIPFLEWMVFIGVIGWVAAMSIYLIKKTNKS